MKIFRQLGAAAAALLCIAAGGCSGLGLAESEAPQQPEQHGEDIVELDFYICNSQVPQQQRVMDKANAIIEDKLGVHLNLICLDSGTYAEKINRMIQSGTEFDLCFMANWSGINFYQNAAAGAFVDMTDLFAQYAPQTYSRIPEVLWDGVKVNDRIYASVNYQQWGVTQRKGYGVRMDIAEEVGFDWTQLKDKPALEALGLLEGFFEKALPLHPDMIGWETSAIYSFFLNDPLYWDMEEVGDMSQPGWIRYEEPEKVINQFATPEFEEYCRIMRRWYEKGYVRPDGATLQEVNPDRQSGRLLAEWSYNWPDIIDATPTGVEELTLDGFARAGYIPEGMSMTQTGQAPSAEVSATRTVIPAAAATTACVAISSTSRHPELAMQLIELLNTDDELFNLIQWGEEGIDYKYDEEGNFVQIDGQYNFHWNEWQIGQSYSPTFSRSDIDRNKGGEEQKKRMRMVLQADQTAESSPLTGFVFDPTPVSSQLADCADVIASAVPLLSNGAVDPDTALPEFLANLQKAGVDAVIAEKQAQYDAWRAQKG